MNKMWSVISLLLSSSSAHLRPPRLQKPLNQLLPKLFITLIPRIRVLRLPKKDPIRIKNHRQRNQVRVGGLRAEGELEGGGD